MRRFINTPVILRELGLSFRLPDRSLAIAEQILGIRALEAICVDAGVTRANADVPTQIRDVFARADIAYDVSDSEDFAAAQSGGPLIFYGNHPFGIADALIGLDLALARRPDTKVLANKVLDAFDINTDHIIWIDPFTGPASNAVNQRGLREALKHLRGGGALLMFPAGECSHLVVRKMRVDDPPWSQHLPRFVSGAKAASVPIRFDGRNSLHFQVLGLIHPMLRTLLLLREFVELRGKRIRVRVGRVHPYEARDGSSDVHAQTLRLRERVYALANDADGSVAMQTVAD